jgi:hypothetical protein
VYEGAVPIRIVVGKQREFVSAWWPDGVALEPP